MRRVLVLSLVLATGCLYTHRNAGRFEISWNLVDANGDPGPTCESYRLAEVLVIVTERKTQNVTGFGASCVDGALLTKPFPLGDYDLEIQAMGDQADLAGEVKLDGTLVSDDADPMVPATIRVAPPATQLQSNWVLTKQGAPTTCDALGGPYVQVVMTPIGGAGIVGRIWRCSDVDTTIDVPYGPFTVMGAIGDTQQILATATPTEVSAARGLVTVDLSFDVP